MFQFIIVKQSIVSSFITGHSRPFPIRSTNHDNNISSNVILVQCIFALEIDHGNEFTLEILQKQIVKLVIFDIQKI